MTTKAAKWAPEDLAGLGVDVEGAAAEVRRVVREAKERHAGLLKADPKYSGKYVEPRAALQKLVLKGFTVAAREAIVADAADDLLDALLTDRG
jgi:hypothetical protein